MSMDIVTFEGKLHLILASNAHYAHLETELSAVATQLATDTVTHDTTLKRSPAGLIPGQRRNTPFTNDILLLVNRGKGGNLSNSSMAAAMTAVLPVAPPANSVAPVVAGTPADVGTTFTCTTGTWSGSPTYTRQWLRSGANIAGGTAATYTAVAADAGTNLSCRVTAANAGGDATAISNVIAIA
jgi:hypothetical protein